MQFLHTTTAMDCKSTAIGGLEASLKLNYVLVVPAEQAVMLHSELLARGVPERQIYEVDPNRRPRPHKLTVCGPVAETSGAGGRKRGREKRFMPGSIKLGTYFAGGQQYNVRLRWGSVWISMADRASGADSGGVSEVTVADGGGASEVSPIADSGGVVEVQPVGDSSAAVVAISKKDDINMPMDGDGGRETEDEKNLTALDRGCGNDSDDPNLGNGNRRCNSSSTLCEDCKRWLLHEYFDERSHDELSDVNGRHACIYRRIVDRLFVVTVTEGGGAGDDDDEDDDGMACCETLDDIVVERPSTATDCATTNVDGSSEREPPLDGPTTLAQPAPPSPGKGDRVDGAAKNAGEKPKKRTFFGKFCKSNKKTKKNLQLPKTD